MADDATAGEIAAIGEAARADRFEEAVDRLGRVAGGEPALANVAAILAAGGRPDHVAKLAPARLNALVHTGWLLSLLTGRPVNAAGDPLPWITYPAIDFLEQHVRPDWRVLEWGCGNSTRWWASRVRGVTSIEHDAEWHRAVAAAVPANVAVHLVSPDDYANPAVLAAGGRFDVTVIDGEDRNRCARTAAARTEPTGLIVFDNSDRGGVRDGLAFLMGAGWKRVDFFGLLPSFAYRTCTSVFFKDDRYVTGGPLPCDTRTSLGPTLSQVLGE